MRSRSGTSGSSRYDSQHRRYEGISNGAPNCTLVGTLLGFGQAHNISTASQWLELRRAVRSYKISVMNRTVFPNGTDEMEDVCTACTTGKDDLKLGRHSKTCDNPKNKHRRLNTCLDDHQSAGAFALTSTLGTSRSSFRYESLWTAVTAIAFRFGAWSNTLKARASPTLWAAVRNRVRLSDHITWSSTFRSSRKGLSTSRTSS